MANHVRKTKCGLLWVKDERELTTLWTTRNSEGDLIGDLRLDSKSPTPNGKWEGDLYVAKTAGGISNGNVLSFRMKNQTSLEEMLENATVQVRTLYEGLEPVKEAHVLGDVPPEDSDKLDGLLLDVRMAKVEPTICDLKGLARRHNELAEAAHEVLVELRRRIDANTLF